MNTDNPRLHKTHPYLDIAGGLFAFGVGRAIGLHPVLALAGAGAVWYYLP